MTATSVGLIDNAYLTRHRLIAGNMSASVAICALWKDLTRVSFDPDLLSHVALIGNLYSARGISLLIRGLWLAPTIRDLVIWGPDTQHTGRDLIRLWGGGLTEDHTIAESNVAIDPAIPRDSIDHLTSNITIHDQREIRSVEGLGAFIKQLEPRSPHASPVAFPESPSPAPETLPSGNSGWLVRTNKIAEAWSRLLDLTMRFGSVKHSQYGISQRELLNITSVVTGEINGAPHLPEFLPITLKALNEYLPRITSGENHSEHSYTYGNRLKTYFERDQIEIMISQLRKAPHTRRAIATLWDPRSDPDRDTPPCLTQITANIVDNRLFVSYTARSQDVYAAWPLNTFGILAVQNQIASELKLQPGPLTSHTVSAHIYEHDWQLASDVIQARQKEHHALVFDPHGNFEIRLEEGQILVSLIDPSGQNILWQAHGTDALALGYEIAAMRLASEPAHMIYLGRELQRAQDALENHHVYVQDRA